MKFFPLFLAASAGSAIIFMAQPSFGEVTGCLAVETCADNAVSNTIEQCLTRYNRCRDGNTVHRALSAATLGQNAVRKQRCDSQKFSDTRSCILCFESAKSLLTSQKNAPLFRGLFDHAIAEIGITELAKCDGMVVR